MNIALIGPPGAGKGTQAECLLKTFSLEHLSTGMLFRDHLARQDALGILARQYMRAGNLVPDEIVDAMIEETLRKHFTRSQLLFDGFPRTPYQARFLDDLLADLDRSLDAAIYLNVTDEVIVDRLQGREICRGCQAPYHIHHRPPESPSICDHCGGTLYRRDDDHPTIIRKRVTSCHQILGDLADYYQSRGKLIIVDGNGTIPAVLETITGVFESIRGGSPTYASKEETAQLKTHHQETPILGTEDTDHRGLDLVLLGGPGSGKGTQAQLLREHFKVPHIASGDLFRENLKKQTDLGKLASTYIRNGELVPDDITFSMVHDRLEQPDTRDGFVLDGFPRNLHQARALAGMMTEMHRRITGVLYLKVSDEEIVRRITGRMICRVCQTPFHLEFKPPKEEGHCDVCGGELYQREDDNLKTVKARLRTFHGQTEPLLDFYRDQDLLIEIAGEGPPEEVTSRMIEAADSLAPVQPEPI